VVNNLKSFIHATASLNCPGLVTPGDEVNIERYDAEAYTALIQKLNGVLAKE
jgi:hypothetical protein